MWFPPKPVFLLLLLLLQNHFQQVFFYPIPPSLQLSLDHKLDVSCAAAAANLLPPRGAINPLQRQPGVEDTTPTSTGGKQESSSQRFSITCLTCWPSSSSGVRNGFSWGCALVDNYLEVAAECRGGRQERLLSVRSCWGGPCHRAGGHSTEIMNQ